MRVALRRLYFRAPLLLSVGVSASVFTYATNIDEGTSSTSPDHGSEPGSWFSPGAGVQNAKVQTGYDVNNSRKSDGRPVTELCVDSSNLYD